MACSRTLVDCLRIKTSTWCHTLLAVSFAELHTFPTPSPTSQTIPCTYHKKKWILKRFGQISCTWTYGKPFRRNMRDGSCDQSHPQNLLTQTTANTTDVAWCSLLPPSSGYVFAQKAPLLVHTSKCLPGSGIFLIRSRPLMP